MLRVCSCVSPFLIEIPNPSTQQQWLYQTAGSALLLSFLQHSLNSAVSKALTLFAAIKSLSSRRALGCPGYSSHLPALQGRWQKLHRNIIFAASARCRRPLQFHFKCTLLHKELGGWINRYLSLRFAAEIVSHLDVFEHWLQKWPLFLGSKIWKTILGNYPDLCIS